MEILDLNNMQQHEQESLIPQIVHEQSNQQQDHIVSGNIKFCGLNSRQAKVKLRSLY